MSERSIVGSLTGQELHTLHQKLEAGPEKYTKRIRIYVDVDGVVMPIIYNPEELDKLDGKNTIRIVNIDGFFSGDKIDIVEELFVYNQQAAQKLSEWSHRDDVDFVWLTSWKMNAPYALDELLNIKSVGFLPWDRRMSDYNHAFKGIAIEDDQIASPSKFVWLDDFANKRRGTNVPFFTRGRYNSRWVEAPDGHFEELGFVVEKEIIDPTQYLTVTTEDTIGLSKNDISTIDEWLLLN